MDSSRAGGDMFLIKSCVDRVVVEESDEEKVKEEDENVKEEKEEKKDEEEKEEKVPEEETKEDKVTIDFEAPEWLINAALELNNQDVALTRTWLSEHAKMYILGKDLGDEEEKMTKLNDEDFDDAAVGIQAFEHLVLLNRHTHTLKHNKLTQVLHSFHSEDVESSLCESSSSENASSMSIEDDRDRTAGESHVFLTQTTLKYLPPRPSQQHRVFEWYVVFDFNHFTLSYFNRQLSLASLTHTARTSLEIKLSNTNSIRTKA